MNARKINLFVNAVVITFSVSRMLEPLKLPIRQNLKGPIANIFGPQDLGLMGA